MPQSTKTDYALKRLCDVLEKGRSSITQVCLEVSNNQLLLHDQDVSHEHYKLGLFSPTVMNIALVRHRQLTVSMLMQVSD